MLFRSISSKRILPKKFSNKFFLKHFFFQKEKSSQKIKKNSKIQKFLSFTRRNILSDVVFYEKEAVLLKITHVSKRTVQRAFRVV